MLLNPVYLLLLASYCIIQKGLRFGNGTPAKKCFNLRFTVWKNKAEQSTNHSLTVFLRYIAQSFDILVPLRYLYTKDNNLMKIYTIPDKNKLAETVVLANGTFPIHNISLSILDNCQRLISCDGATDKLVESGRIPQAIVGDCDSLSKENKERFANIIHRVAEQETNDLTKAIHYCVDQGWTDIIILGATGKREDHTIGNISLLCEYMKMANVKMVTDYGVFVAIDSNAKFESFKGQQVSIFCLNNNPISAQGLVYEIKNKIFDRWWQATLNESEGDEFTIEANGATIIYRKF